MGVPRDLVALEEALRDTPEVDPFASLERSGLLGSPEAGALASQLRRFDLSDPLHVVRLCLQALRVQRQALEPFLLDAELVATLPLGVPGIARSTAQVLREMLRPPVEEVILLGYEITDRDIMRALAKAAQNGASVIMICDRERGAADNTLDDWPSSVPVPRVFVDKRRDDGAPYAKMHAKCLLVDSADLLVTSANFTFHGLHGNIEIGLRVSGQPAREARKIFSHLVESGAVEEKS